MAVIAERHVVGLVFHQQIGLSRSVRLMAGETTERRLDLALIGWVHHVGDGVILHRVTQAKAQRQNRDLVLLVVVVGQLDCAVEDGENVLRFIPLRNGIGTVALQAERIALGAQQMIVVAAVRRVAGGAALHKGRLMVHGFLAQIVDVAVTSQADADRVGLGQAGLVAGVRAVAIGAIARRAGMRHLGRVDQLGLVVMAGDAQSSWRRAASAPLFRLLPARGRCRSSLPQTAHAGTSPSAWETSD